MAALVRLINIANLGPVLAVIQGESPDRMVVTNPIQLGTDAEGEIILCDYLEFISQTDKPVEFFKSNIVSISEANPALVEVYVETIKSIEDEKSAPKLIVPSNTIITN